VNLLKKEHEKKTQEKDIEEILEKTWKNWESRRKCEQTHHPKYLNKQDSKKS